jgi:hypothetical protein
VFHRDGVSRLEGFSDAVFGFALTLLVVNLETPDRLHARVRQAQLQLSPLDLLVLKYSLRGHIINMSIGLASLAFVWVVPQMSWLAGLVYFLMGPLHGWNGYMGGRAKAELADA